MTVPGECAPVRGLVGKHPFKGLKGAAQRAATASVKRPVGGGVLAGQRVNQFADLGKYAVNLDAAFWALVEHDASQVKSPCFTVAKGLTQSVAQEG
jgi:hypothetical protein